MNGQPLPANHGKQLRLIIPVKYSIKNLKRIDSISFSNKRPPDYWPGKAMITIQFAGTYILPGQA